jgi:hypothetical protein
MEEMPHQYHHPRSKQMEEMPHQYHHLHSSGERRFSNC